MQTEGEGRTETGRGSIAEASKQAEKNLILTDPPSTKPSPPSACRPQP